MYFGEFNYNEYYYASEPEEVELLLKTETLD